MKLLKELIRDEAGQTTTEYGLLLGILALAVVAILFGMRGSLKNLFGKANTALANAESGAAP
jgi:pilus assembly protein Flp/PilA